MTAEVQERRGFRGGYIIPLVILALMSVLFAVALRSGDPSRLPSALIGKHVPEFALPPVVMSSLPGPPGRVTAVAAAGTAAQNRFKVAGLDLAFFSFCSPTSALCNGPNFGY